MSLSGAAALEAQDLRRDVLAGHVTVLGGAAVVGATVAVLAVGASAEIRPQTARTDAEGRWFLAVQEGPGQYVVHVTAIGMRPAQDTASRTGRRGPIIVDFRLEPIPVVLSALTVVARPRPPREIVAEDQAALDLTTNNFFYPGAIAVADRGDLATIAASASGMMLLPDGGGPGGFSVLGLSADQNRATLNGAPFGGADLPRDAYARTNVVATSYDVSRGGFSGGQVSILINRGGNNHSRMAHVTLDAPAL